MSTKKNETQKKLPAPVTALHERTMEEIESFTDAVTTVSILREKGVDVDEKTELYVTEIFKYPCLTKESVDKELEIIAKCKDGRASDDYAAAVSDVAFTYFCLVLSIAADYRDKGSHFLDLVQCGNEGLFKAVEDYHRVSDRYSFTEYAVLHVRHKMIKWIKDGLSNPVPVPYYEIIDPVRDSAEKLREKLGREATSEEVAEDTGYNLAAVQTVLIYLERSKRYREILSGECMMDFDPADYD